MTTADLRAYLDAHGVDGPPTDPGWYVIDTTEFARVPRTGIGYVRHSGWRPTAVVVRPDGLGWSEFGVDVRRHAPLNLWSEGER